MNLPDTEQTLQGIHPTIPDDCSDNLRELMEKCWIADPDERPTLKELIDSHLLHEVRNNIKRRANTEDVNNRPYWISYSTSQTWQQRVKFGSE